MPEQIKTRKAGLASLCAHTRRMGALVNTLPVTELRGEKQKEEEEKIEEEKNRRGKRAFLCHPIFRRLGGDSERAFLRDSRETRGALTWPDKIVRVPLIIHTRRRRRDIARATLEIARAHTHARVSTSIIAKKNETVKIKIKQ